jgi:hypothetical protein
MANQGDAEKDEEMTPVEAVDEQAHGQQGHNAGKQGLSFESPPAEGLFAQEAPPDGQEEDHQPYGPQDPELEQHPQVQIVSRILQDHLTLPGAVSEQNAGETR